MLSSFQVNLLGGRRRVHTDSLIHPEPPRGRGVPGCTWEPALAIFQLGRDGLRHHVVAFSCMSGTIDEHMGLHLEFRTTLAHVDRQVLVGKPSVESLSAAVEENHRLLTVRFSNRHLVMRHTANGNVAHTRIPGSTARCLFLWSTIIGTHSHGANHLGDGWILYSSLA